MLENHHLPVKFISSFILVISALFFQAIAVPETAWTRDLAEIRAEGALRHLGVPYAGFIIGPNQGLDVEIMQAFANHLGVRYEFVPTDWTTAIPSLTGKTFTIEGDSVQITGDAAVMGDVLATGLTILPWRKTILNFSAPTFPTQVWLVVSAKSPITPITPTGDLAKDIQLTHEKFKDQEVLCKSGTCLDPRLFNLAAVGARGKEFPGSLNDLAPAVIMGEAGATLLDVPDAMVALQKFPGRIKIIGPLGLEQEMAVGFAKDQPELLAEFNRFFAEFKHSGRLLELVNKYYPMIHRYYPTFFAN